MLLSWFNLLPVEYTLPDDVFSIIEGDYVHTLRVGDHIYYFNLFEAESLVRGPPGLNLYNLSIESTLDRSLGSTPGSFTVEDFGESHYTLFHHSDWYSLSWHIDTAFSYKFPLS